MHRQRRDMSVVNDGEERKDAGPQFSGDRSAFFEELLAAKKTWSEIVEELVLKKVPGDSEEARIERLDAMTALVELRDTLDFKEYESIAHRLFPAEEFRVQCTSKRETRKRQDGDYDTLLEYYQIRVARGPSNGKNAVIADDEPHCTISIKAPGSRNYTSDIDTTVEVSDASHLALSGRDLGRLFEGHQEKQREFQAIKKLNANSLIKIALIDQFYANCETRYHMTSATNRDSNTYSDGFLGFYPNFELSDPSNNPATEDGSIFPEDKLSFYAEKKEESDLIELSASFVSLRQVLSDQEWAEFKKSALEGEECKDILSDLSREQQEKIKGRLEYAMGQAEGNEYGVNY